MRGVMLRSVPLRCLAVANNTNVKVVFPVAVAQRRHNSDLAERKSWNVAISGLSGFWSHLTNEQAREEFQSFVGAKVINQDALTQNSLGRIQMFALLHGLMNPMFRKYQFDAAEFVTAVGPALQIYHETLLQLMTEATTISNVAKEEVVKRLSDEIGNNADDDDDDSIEAKNSWRVEAERDPTSLAGRFMMMVTNENLKEQYHNAQMIKLFSNIGIPAPMNYVKGSCEVEYVSLLNAKAIEIDDTFDDQNENPDNNISRDGTFPVLARIQVLYKLSRQFQKRSKGKSNDLNSSPTSASQSYKSINTEVTSSLSSTMRDDKTTTTDTATTTAAAEDSADQQLMNEDPEKYSETRLGVAIFEGWLFGGNSGSSMESTNHNHQRPTPQLRWKVASAKESNQFW